jgi:hypothetical protein
MATEASASITATHSKFIGPYISGGIVLAIFLSFVLLSTFVWTGGWIMVLFREHYVFFVGLPLAALLAHFLVGTLENTRGQIQFEAAGVTFKGASGPIIMWVLVYLALVVSFTLAWSLRA